MANVKKNIGFQLFYRVLTVITPLITSPLLSRALGAQTLGVYSGTLTYVSYFLMFTLLGMENYGNRLIASVQGDREKRDTAFWNAYAVQLLAFLITGTAYFVSLGFISPERRTFQLMQGVWLLAYGLDISWFYFGCEEFSLTVQCNTLVKLLTVVSIVLFVHSPADLPVYILIMAGGELLCQLVLWANLHRYASFRRPEWAEMKRHIRPVLVLFIPVLAGSVYHLMDKTMLDALSDETNLGYYYSADKVVSIPLGLIRAVGTVLLPRITNMMGRTEQKDILRLEGKAVELTTFLASCVGFGIAAVALEFVPAFFGPGYEPCVVLLYWFVPVLFAKAWNSAIRAQYLIPAHKDSSYIISTFAGAAVNLVLNYFLIKRYAAVGAVIATFVAEAVVLLVEMLAAREAVPFGRFFLRSSVYLLLGGGMFLGVSVLRRVLPLEGVPCLLALIAAGAVIYLAMAAVYWRLDKNSVFHGTAARFLRLPERKG